VFGGLFVCVLRYICHVISGATVWAGISIPTLGATIYSLSYNATYMIPETIVSLVVAYFLGSSLDFNREMPITLKKDKDRKINVFSIIAGLIAAAAVVVDAILIFANLQDPETGEFYIQGLSNANWPLIGIITGGALVVSAVLFIIGKKVCKKD
jgi:thiamine transporter